jgi:RNA polymerase sigma-70 factor (ECF subfamily)
VYRASGNAADADDIVQDAFIRVLNENIPEATEEAMRKYLFRVATNLMADRWRRSKREQPRVQHGEEHAVATTPQSDIDVTRTFAELKPRERALLWLAYVEGEAHDEIAESLGIKRGSVKVLLSRARARLRDLLKARDHKVRT